ncbi:MAG: 50S ribosomal protein L23 [Acidobacteria bacterium]|nr:MAG: 50S ribosomal protein L23 [Acidobacteriota bacterium]REK03145.1 MAG: 50S ribosomal protein L23 [Acidobacteriota bacterium]REK15400.1 MAG: 50S ribosomal protein L23 [Acidobacteriota bacterium]REK42119.1 MAG: 50S ribosomal protein L23 [Acidobacteriota bacterium]
MNIWDVLKAPVVTEKSVLLKEAFEGGDEAQVLTFKVDRQATKEDIRRAVEEIFSVKVDKIRTTNYKGKMKRQGRYEGRRADWKKAYVTLKAGEPHVDYAEAI